MEYNRKLVKKLIRPIHINYISEVFFKNNIEETRSEINKMIREAEENAESDRQLRELIDARNGAEAAFHEVKRELKERDAVLTESVKSSVNAAIVVVEDAIRGEDADAMRTAVEKLWESARPVMEANAQQQAQPADDGVVDAEFTETK